MTTQPWDTLWLHATLCPCEQDLTCLQDAAIAASNGKIVWMGPTHTLPASPERLAKQCYDVEHRLLTPGLIDCHTHLIFAGNRTNEFEQRLLGSSYETIAKQGGGIQATVNAVRLSTPEALFKQSLARAAMLMQSGVTTIEIKSGYGLNWENEVKMLEVAHQIALHLPLTVKKTFLGAHVVPKEFTLDPAQYVRLLCEEMIPAIAKTRLADAIDVFCEPMAFNLSQTKTLFEAAIRHGLAIKCHAEQLSNTGAAALAASMGALSVDHLEWLSQADLNILAASNTVAVLLPAAFYFLREKHPPPIQALREANVPMALATDCNPGTAPVMSLLMVLNLACTLFSMTPQEALLGVTKHAAAALGLASTHGTLTLHKQADFAIWHATHPVELAYYIGAPLLHQLVKNGVVVRESRS